jgi:hypothetical protein
MTTEIQLLPIPPRIWPYLVSFQHPMVLDEVLLQALGCRPVLDFMVCSHVVIKLGYSSVPKNWWVIGLTKLVLISPCPAPTL